MAFMALFGWIFLLMIPAFYIGMALEAVLAWAAAHVLLVNVMLVLLLAPNVLILWVLLKIRAKWKREGKLKASYARRDPTLRGFLGRFTLFCGLAWEFFVIIAFLALLIFQPIPRLAGILL